MPPGGGFRAGEHGPGRRTKKRCARGALGCCGEALATGRERFEPEREIKFETFAITRIKGSIIDELRSLDWVPRSVRAKAREIEKVNAQLENELQRAPTDQEMAEKLAVSVSRGRGSDRSRPK